MAPARPVDPAALAAIATAAIAVRPTQQDTGDATDVAGPGRPWHWHNATGDAGVSERFDVVIVGGGCTICPPPCTQ